MTNPHLHNLDRIPASASVCIVGRKGRNSRFKRLLSVLRPDIEILSVVDTEDPDPCRHLYSKVENAVEIARSARFILITSGNYKQAAASQCKWNFATHLIVDQNFQHPFFQFDGMENEHVKKLAEAKDLFPHDADRSFYDLVLSAIQVRSDLQGVYLKLVELYSRMGSQYLDFINRSAIHTVIEGGVADGRNTVEFLGHFSKPTIYGFEPDSKAFHNSYYRRFLENNPSVRILPLGLWRRAERLPFEIKKVETSKVALPSDTTPDACIDTVSIDEFVRDNSIEKVDFIKLDIEGSEYDAIQGAEETVRIHRPQIAVCIYHLLEHHYQIPLFLAELAPDYIFRIGHYSPIHVFSETVLYGIPREIHEA